MVDLESERMRVQRHGDEEHGERDGRAAGEV